MYAPLGAILLDHVCIHFHGSLYPMMDYVSGVYYGLFTPCLLMFHGVHYNSFTTSYCIGFAILWLLVQWHRLMWPLVRCISSNFVRTPRLQLGVLQSLRGSFLLCPILLSHLALSYLWWKPGQRRTSLSLSTTWPKSGIREWTPLHYTPGSSKPPEKTP